MAYHWKPSASQRRAFADRMQNPIEKADYEQRKQDKADKRRAGSAYSYSSAGGNYIPTEDQWKFCMFNWPSGTTPEQENARQQVLYGFSCQEKVHHDYIHIVNELIRSKYSPH